LLIITGVALAEKSKLHLYPGDRTGTLIHQGIRRHYLIHIPNNLPRNQPVPLVFVLHGGGGNPAAIARLTGFSLLADSAGFIVVYPEAVNRHWNDGRDVRRFRSHRKKIDDTGFISSLIDTLDSRLKIDPSRIYACGISNGGMMCHRLGIELPDRLAAIATVAAALPENLLDRFQPAAPLAVLMFNGTADPLVPYEGGYVGINGKNGRVISVERTAELWAEFNRCAREPEQTVIATNPEKPEIICKKFPGGIDGTEVVLYRLNGAGHIWPGGKRRPLKFGTYLATINATRIIWDFFQRHCRH